MVQNDAMKFKNEMQEPTQLTDTVSAFIIDARADEYLKQLGENSGLIATRYSDSSVLLVGSDELFKKFWTLWQLAVA